MRTRTLDEVIHGLERRRRQPVEAAVEGVMLGHILAVEIGELAQRYPIGDAFAQLAIVPVLQAHQNKRAQHLRRDEAAATLVRLIQAAQEVVAHPFDQRRLLIEKITDRLRNGSSRTPCRSSSRSAKLICRAAG